MLLDQIKATGSLVIDVTDAAGAVVDRRAVDNLVVTTGRNFIASRMAGATPGSMTHMAVGTGAAGAALGDTTLGAELVRVALSSTTPTNNTVAFSATFPPGTGTGALTEAGLFNAASAGTLLCRTTFATVNKAAGDTLSIIWTVTIS